MVMKNVLAFLEEMFDEIYENFYDHLPEEEQLLVEVYKFN